jgi:hypothetical protein
MKFHSLNERAYVSFTREMDKLFKVELFNIIFTNAECEIVIWKTSALASFESSLNTFSHTFLKARIIAVLSVCKPTFKLSFTKSCHKGNVASSTQSISPLMVLEISSHSHDLRRIKNYKVSHKQNNIR